MRIFALGFNMFCDMRKVLFVFDALGKDNFNWDYASLY
jgi:hypothetical protein